MRHALLLASLLALLGGAGCSCGADSEPAKQETHAAPQADAAPAPGPAPADLERVRLARERAAAVPGLIPNEEHAAGLRATKYLIDAAPGLDPVWSVTTFERLYKVVPTEGLARTIKEIFDDAMSRPIARVPDRFDSPRWLRADVLRPVVIELWRRRMVGGDWREPAAAIEAFLALDDNEPTFWQPIKATQQLVFLHLFETVDIETRRTRTDVARELRERWAREDRDALLHDIEFMYGVTHVIYVDTGYCDRYLDSARYPTEVEVVEAALARYAARFPVEPVFVDLGLELLSVRRFLQLPETAEARILKRKLLVLQDENGAWRPGSGNDTIHATREGVHAFGRFPSELRRLEPRLPAAP